MSFDNRNLFERRRAASFFPPLPVTVPPGLTPGDKLVAAWAGVPDPPVEGVTYTVREARRRLIALRRERGIGTDGWPR